MFYRHDRPPGLSPFTVLLAILWLLLAVYIITHPDPIGIIILVVMGVFIAGPALFVAVVVWRARQADDSAFDPNEHHGLNGRDGHNGRHATGANGAQHEVDEMEEMSEIPDEGGGNP